MTLLEASKESGFSVRTLYRRIQDKAFVAFLPRGRRGGWHVNETSFRDWVKKQFNATSNLSTK